MLAFLKPEERLLWKHILRASENGWYLQRKCSPYHGSTEMSLFHFVIIEKDISFLFDVC